MRSRRRPQNINLTAMREENQKIERDGGSGFTVETLEEKLKADQRSKPHQNTLVTFKILQRKWKRVEMSTGRF